MIYAIDSRAFFIVTLMALHCQLACGQPQDGEWEASIREFEKQDQVTPVPTGGILFVGSSSIRLWNLPEMFPHLPTINRGFGGSQMSDVLQYMHRIVVPYRPRIVVLYEGDNDIAAGKSATRVADDFRKFAQSLHQSLPETQLIVLSVKPSLARWSMYPRMQQVNLAMADYCQQDERCHFVDVSEIMLGADDQPLKELFIDDGLHLNTEGYRRWSRRVRPLLTSP